MSRTLQIAGPWRLCTPDQALLPFDERWIELTSATSCRDAIVHMQVRGAPLIGAVAAFGLAFALREEASDEGLDSAVAWLGSARPTAVNLRWALALVQQGVRALAPCDRAQAAWQIACAVCEADVQSNARIGQHGAALLKHLSRDNQRPLQLLTHCNAGSLATIAHGTALAPIYALHEAGIAVHVWVDETRPRNQGALITAWELARAGVAHTVIADNAGGLLMREGRVDAVITGCDRVAANGDVANKIGTYLKALAAFDNDLPFYVACPVSTLDAAAPNGAAIEIEYRDTREVTHTRARRRDGSVEEVALMMDNTVTLNPAFDLTPARLVTGLITEYGVVPAQAQSIAATLERARDDDLIGSLAR